MNERQPNSKSSRYPNYRFRMFGLMLFADLIGFLLPLLIISRTTILNSYFLSINLTSVTVSMALFMISRLYPGTGISPPQEIRMVTQYTLIAYVLGWFGAFVLRQSLMHHRLHYMGSWVGSVILILILRWSIRIVSVYLGWWREPVIVIARGQKATNLVHYFRKRLRIGYWPVLAISDTEGIDQYIPLADEPIIHLEQIETALPYIEQYRIRTALVSLSVLADMDNPPEGISITQLTRNIIFISDLDWLTGVTLLAHDFEGLHGVEMRPNELSWVNLAIKSITDVILSSLTLLVLTPILVLIALLVKIDSRGPVFYRHERIGQHGRKFKVIKFRTMHVNSDQELLLFLQANPEARREWEENHKLKHDPRITHIGKFLRKFSLDELPQLFNILRGDISLVGARPIVEEEIHHFGEKYAVYTRFKPGLTGLWQVSGRSNTSYAERIRYDSYYINNWSVWLDIYILLRTVWVIIRGEGAY